MIMEIPIAVEPPEPIRPIPVAPSASQSTPATPASPAPARPAQTTTNLEGLRDYSRIYDIIKEGENQQFAGDTQPALEKYLHAREQLLALKSQHPDFQPFIVDYRLRDLQRRIERLSAAPSE